MRKKVIVIGIVLFLVGIIFEFLSGATLPGNFTIPIIYGSNQILWLFVAAVGFIAVIVGLFLKPKNK